MLPICACAMKEKCERRVSNFVSATKETLFRVYSSSVIVRIAEIVDILNSGNSFDFRDKPRTS